MHLKKLLKKFCVGDIETFIFESDFSDSDVEILNTAFDLSFEKIKIKQERMKSKKLEDGCDDILNQT